MLALYNDTHRDNNQEIKLIYGSVSQFMIESASAISIVSEASASLPTLSGLPGDDFKISFEFDPRTYEFINMIHVL